MFGEEFLLKLGVDVNTKEVKQFIKLAKELKGLQGAINKRKASSTPAITSEVKKEKQLIALKRKRLQYQKKLQMAEKLGMKVDKKKFLAPTRYSKQSTLDNKILDLDKALSEYSLQHHKEMELEREKQKQAKRDLEKQKELEKEKREQIKKSARELQKALEISSARIKQAARGISNRNIGGTAASGTLLAEMLRQEEADDNAKRANEKSKIRDQKEQLRHQRRMTRLWKKSVNDFAHTFGTLAAVYGLGTAVATSQQTKIGLEQASVQMDVAFGEQAGAIVDGFVTEIRSMNLGIGQLQATEAISKLMPALKNRFSQEDSIGMSKNLLLAGKLFGQLPHMSEIARNFAQISTSFEMEDINQFRDRFTALMPMIEKQLVSDGVMQEGMGLKRAKELGQIQRDDFLKAFQSVMNNVAKDKNLQHKLSNNLFVSWNTLLAGIENTQLSFMGKISSRGIESERDSLSEALHESYKSITDSLQTSRHTIRNFGEIVGKVVKAITYLLLNLQVLYYTIAKYTRDLFGLTDDQAEQAIIWALLTPLLVSFAAITAKVVMALTKLGKVIRLVNFSGFGATIASIRAGMFKLLSFFKKFGIVAIITNALEVGIKTWQGRFSEAGKDILQMIGWVFGTAFAPLTGGLSLLLASIFSDIVEFWNTDNTVWENLKALDAKFVETVNSWLNEILSWFGADPISIGNKSTGSDTTDAKKAIDKDKLASKFEEPLNSGFSHYTGSGKGSLTPITIHQQYQNNYSINEANNPASTASQVGFEQRRIMKEGKNSIADSLAINN